MKYFEYFLKYSVDLHDYVFYLITAQIEPYENYYKNIYKSYRFYHTKTLKVYRVFSNKNNTTCVQLFHENTVFLVKSNAQTLRPLVQSFSDCL